MSDTQGRTKKGAKQPFPTFLRLIFPDNLSKYGNMDKIVYKLVYNRKKRLNRQGVALVQIEAYLARKKKYFSTQVYLKPTQWDARRAMVKRHPNADDLNHLMHRQMERMEKTELELRRQGRHVTLDTLKAAVENECSHRSFTAFYRQEVENAPVKESTRRNHLTTLARLEEFKKDITFEDVTFELVAAFEQHLRAKGYHPNTVAKHMKHLKRQVNVAINKDYMEIGKYPFRKYKIKMVENKHSHLTPEELRRLEALHPEGRQARLRHTLDAFLFCCYAGLRYSDFNSLSAAHLMTIGHKTWLVYRSVKTRAEVRLPIYLLFGGKGLDILKHYAGRLDDFFCLKNNSNVNKQLQALSRLAGLQKHISFHSARHTNATLLVYSGVNITTVQKLLGHKSVKTTQGYANVMDMTVVHDLEKSAGRRKRQQ